VCVAFLGILQLLSRLVRLAFDARAHGPSHGVVFLSFGLTGSRCALLSQLLESRHGTRRRKTNPRLTRGLLGIAKT
jgi:hypothetical protein